jgi:hypothetical protein
MIVEVRYLYCHPGDEGKLIQARYFGKLRDRIGIAECSVSQLKVKAGDGEAAGAVERKIASQSSKSLFFNGVAPAPRL